MELSFAMGKHNNRKRFRGGAVRSNPINAMEECIGENGTSNSAETEADVLTKITSQLQSGNG